MSLLWATQDQTRESLVRGTRIPGCKVAGEASADSLLKQQNLSRLTCRLRLRLLTPGPVLLAVESESSRMSSTRSNRSTTQDPPVPRRESGSKMSSILRAKSGDLRLRKERTGLLAPRRQQRGGDQQRVFPFSPSWRGRRKRDRNCRLRQKNRRIMYEIALSTIDTRSIDPIGM